MLCACVISVEPSPLATARGHRLTQLVGEIGQRGKLRVLQIGLVDRELGCR